MAALLYGIDLRRRACDRFARIFPLVPMLPRLISGLSEIAPGHDALICDVWGVVHDGHRHHPAAAEALYRFKRKSWAGGAADQCAARAGGSRGAMRQLWPAARLL